MYNKVISCLRKVMCGVLACVSLTGVCFAEDASVPSILLDNEDASIVSIDELDYPCNNDLIEEGYLLVDTDYAIDNSSNTLIVDRTYVLEDNHLSVLSSGEIGSKTVKKSRSIYSDNDKYDLLIIMWASGKFSWNEDNDTATVTDAKGWYDIYYPSNSGAKVSKTNLENKNNQGATTLGGLFGHKYAYVQYIVTLKNQLGYTREEKLWIDVNVVGDVTVKE